MGVKPDLLKKRAPSRPEMFCRVRSFLFAVFEGPWGQVFVGAFGHRAVPEGGGGIVGILGGPREEHFLFVFGKHVWIVAPRQGTSIP